MNMEDFGHLREAEAALQVDRCFPSITLLMAIDMTIAVAVVLACSFSSMPISMTITMIFSVTITMVIPMAGAVASTGELKI